MLLAAREPMAASDAARTASATRTSIRVKPAELRHSRLVDRYNLDPSRQPIDSHLIAGALPTEGNRPATGHSGRQVADGGAGRTVVATRGQHGIDHYVRGKAHGATAGPRADGAQWGVDNGCDLLALPLRGMMIGFEQRRGLERIGFEARTRGSERNGGPHDGCEHRDNAEDTDDL